MKRNLIYRIFFHTKKQSISYLSITFIQTPKLLFLLQNRPASNSSAALEPNQRYELVCSRKYHGYIQEYNGATVTGPLFRRQMESQLHQDESVKRVSVPTYSSTKRTRSKYYGIQETSSLTPRVETLVEHAFKFTNTNHLRCEHNCERNEIYKTLLQGIHYAM